MPSFALMALGIGLIPFTRDFLTLLLVAMLIGLGNGLGSGLMMTLGADLAPPGHRRVPRCLAADRRRGSGDGPLLVGVVAAAVALWRRLGALRRWLAGGLHTSQAGPETRIRPLDERG